MTIIEPSRTTPHGVFRWWCCSHPHKVIQLRFFFLAFIILVRHLAENKSCYKMIITKFPRKKLNTRTREGSWRRPTKVNESFYFPAKSLPFKRSVTSRVFANGTFLSSNGEKSVRQGVSVDLSLSTRVDGWKVYVTRAKALQPKLGVRL